MDTPLGIIEIVRLYATDAEGRLAQLGMTDVPIHYLNEYQAQKARARVFVTLAKIGINNKTPREQRIRLLQALFGDVKTTNDLTRSQVMALTKAIDVFPELMLEVMREAQSVQP